MKRISSSCVGAWALTTASLHALACSERYSDSKPAELRVVSATEQFVVVRHASIQGRDGGTSGLAFGRSVWTYGDTVLEAPDERGEQWHTNSFGVAEVSSWQTSFNEPVDAMGLPRYFLQRTAEEIAWDDAHAAEECDAQPCHSRWAIWPSQPLFDETSGSAWILYGLYNDDNPSGIGVATWHGLEEAPERVRVADSWLLFPSSEPEYANAPLVHDGALYAFGCVLRGYARPCSLGRVLLASVADRTAWRFFDGVEWVADITSARALFDGQPIMSVGWNEFLQRFFLVYAPPFGHAVYARTAPQLEGPWSDEAKLFDVPGESTYDAVHHKELAEDGGRVQYISYSRPIDRGWFGAEHVVWRVELASGAHK